MTKFMDIRGKEIKEEEITTLFVYEDFLKQLIFEKDTGHLSINVLRNETLKKIYVVPTGN